MQTLRVFVNDLGKFGNPVGIIVDEASHLDAGQRQQAAKSSGFSEIVVINNIQQADISIYTPQNQIPFAGHAALGAAYYLQHIGQVPITQLHSLRAKIMTWVEDDLTWVSCAGASLPPWQLEELASPELVEEITTEITATKDHTVVWAWLDKERGVIRARTFASDWGIPEDEANSSGAMQLALLLKRKLTVYHGRGSIIYAKIGENNSAAVGGLVILD